MSHTPFYIIPLLIEQPTWGGDYIAGFKKIVGGEAAMRKIGQAYELYRDSQISYLPVSAPAYAWVTATDVAHPQYINRPADIQPLQKVIEDDPVGVLGKRVVQKFKAAKQAPEMQVLIKFTQAQNNSYQVHVRPDQEFGKWLAKPESWFYFETGKATLGLREPTKERAAAHLACCAAIEKEAQRLSTLAVAGGLPVAAARQQLQEFIQKNDPHQFVNSVIIRAGQVIDLSAGGIHHSWEMGAEIPRGNILYEVQQNVMDEFCTLRAFDQGNIKDDGTVRPLTITDYFRALDTDPAHNIPENYLQNPPSHQDQSATITPLFQNPHYSTTQITFTERYGGIETENRGSFHHLFAQSGDLEVITDEGHWPVRQGWSLFIPAGVEGYELKTSGTSTVLRTGI